MTSNNTNKDATVARIQAAIQHLITARNQLASSSSSPKASDYPTQVRVAYNAEVITFRLARNTTFAQLERDAKRTWETSEGFIRDEFNNAVFPSDAIVVEEIKHLQDQLGMEDGETYMLRLFKPVRALSRGGSMNIFASTTKNGTMTRSSALGNNINNGSPPTRTSRASSLQNDRPRHHVLTQQSSSILTNSYVEPENTNNGALATAPITPATPENPPPTIEQPAYVLARERRARFDNVASMNIFFRDMDLSQDALMLQSAAGNEDDDNPPIPNPTITATHSQVITSVTASCIWLMFWALTVGLCISTMVFRFDTLNAHVMAANARELLVYNIPTSTINSTSEVWTWIDDIVVPSLFPPARPHAPQIISPGKQILLGNVVLVKQSRVALSTTCSSFNSNVVVDAFTTCWPQYSYSSSLKTSNFGNALPSSSPPFIYSPTATPQPQYGQVSNYDSGGFVLQLTQTFPGEAIQQTETAKASGWLSPFTGLRALVVLVNVADVNSGTLLSVQSLLEFSSTMYQVQTTTVDVMPMSVYGTSGSSTGYTALIIVGDVFLFLYAASGVTMWLLGPWRRGVITLRQGLATIWNLTVLVLLMTSCAQIIVAAVYELQLVPATVFTTPTQYVDYSNLSQSFWTLLGLSSLNLFLLLFTVFKHTQRDMGLTMIWQSLARASRGIWTMGLFLGVALAVMTLWAHLAWGTHVRVWSNPATAAMNLAGLAFGRYVEFDVLRQTEPALEFVVFFFLIWFLVVVLVLVNLFGAVMLDAVVEVSHVIDKVNDGNHVAQEKYGRPDFWWLLGKSWVLRLTGLTTKKKTN